MFFGLWTGQQQNDNSRNILFVVAQMVVSNYKHLKKLKKKNIKKIPKWLENKN